MNPAGNSSPYQQENNSSSASYDNRSPTYNTERTSPVTQVGAKRFPCEPPATPRRPLRPSVSYDTGRESPIQQLASRNLIGSPPSTPRRGRNQIEALQGNLFSPAAGNNPSSLYQSPERTGVFSESLFPRAFASASPPKRQKQSLFKAMAEKAAGLTFSIQGAALNFTAERARGDYKITYFVENMSQETLHLDENTNLQARDFVVQIFDSKDPLQNFQEWAGNAMKQYHFLKEHNQQAAKAGHSQLPIAAIYNRPEEDGYFLCERIHGKWNDPALWQNDSSLKPQNLDSMAFNRLKQCRQFLEFAIEKEEPLDIKPANLGVRLEKDSSESLVLFDYLEDREDGAAIMTNTSINQLCQNPSTGEENLHIRAFLIENFDKLKSNPTQRAVLRRQKEVLSSMTSL